MKKILPFLIIALILASCSKKLELENISYPLQKGTKVTENGGIYLFYPEQDFEINIQGFPAKLDGQYQHKADPSGNIVKGLLSKDFTAQNQFASFTIPAGTQFQRSPEGTEYFFLLKETTGEIQKEDQRASIYEYLLITETLDFATIIFDTFSFVQDGEEVIYNKDDKAVCSSETGFNIKFFTQSYRDQMEINLLKEMDPLPIEALERQFAPHEDMPTQVYYGSGFLLHLTGGEYQARIRSVQDEAEVLTVIGEVTAKEAKVENYSFALEIPLRIKVDEKQEDAQLDLLVHNSELENLQHIIEAEEDLYLLFRMGNFEDSSRRGRGMLYYCYSQEQLDNLQEKSIAGLN